MLDSAIKDQLKGLFAQLEAHYTFDIFVHPQHEVVPSWWTRWKKWLPVRINFPVGCRIVKAEVYLLKRERIRESYSVPYLVAMNLLLC